MSDQERLFTFEFVVLCLVSFFAFCNMSVFYSFFTYLDRIGIPVEWRGFLVGLEPLSAFALRLAIIPLLHVGNAAAAMLIALVMTIIALCSYTWAVTIPTLIALRIFHGAAFVLLVSASMALVVHLIPKQKSAQGFGIVSITVLVPYAIMPLITEVLLRHVENEARIYAGVTLLAIPGILLLLILGKRLARILENADSDVVRRPSLEDLRQNLQNHGVTLLLGVNLLLYLGYSTVFFFMKSHFANIGAGNAGTFFTIATVMMIAVRVLGGTFFDRVDRIKTLKIVMLLLILSFVLFAQVRSPQMLYLLAGYYGLCIGIFLPQLNAAMFLISPPQLRGLNTNLALFTMDGAFFSSPYFGGLLVASGYSPAALFNICAGFLVLALVFLFVVGRSRQVGKGVAVEKGNA